MQVRGGVHGVLGASNDALPLCREVPARRPPPASPPLHPHLPRHPRHTMATLRRALPRGPALHTVFRPPATLPRRHVHIRATPATTALDPPLDLSSATQTIPKLSGAGPFPARVLFEVLGAPYSLLSVSLPASTALFSRRGALVGVNGAVDNVRVAISGVRREGVR